MAFESMQADEVPPQDTPEEAPETEPTQNNEPKSTKNRGRRRIPLSNAQIILIFLIIVGGRLILDFSQRVIEGQDKVAEVEKMEAEVKSLEEENRTLTLNKNYYASSEYVEVWAHSEGKMVKSGEILVIPITNGDSGAIDTLPAPLAVDPRTQEKPDNWEVWWSLFFDNPPSFGK